jgi:hypothetical protein
MRLKQNIPSTGVLEVGIATSLQELRDASFQQQMNIAKIMPD